MPLTIYRRHLKTCPHRDKGAKHLKCSCPIWCIGRLESKSVRESLRTCDMQRAIRLVERKERPNVERTDLLQCAQPGCTKRVEGVRCSEHLQSISGAIQAFHAAHSDLEHGTKISYTRILKAFQAFLGPAAVHDIKLDLIDGFRASRPISANTWKKELQFLRHFFRFCLERKWILDNPARSCAMPKNIKATDKEPYTSGDLVRILAACDTLGRAPYERLRARAMILTLRYTALRISDVATLRRDCVRRGEVYLRTLKNGKVVKLPLHPDLEQALSLVPTPRATPADQESVYFFWSGSGSKESQIRDTTRTLTAVFKSSGVPKAHAHRFRHTLATELLGAGGTFEEVADILGNTPEIVRKHYAKWSVQRQDRVSTLMRSVFHPTRTLDVHDKTAAVSN